MSEESQTLTNGKGGKSKKGVILGVVAGVVIVVLIGVIVFLLWPKKEEKRNVVVTKDNLDEVKKKIKEDEFVKPGYYTVTMNNRWHFKNGQAASEDAYVENVETNTSDVYFDVFLADDETDAILESPVIPPGSSLRNVSLDRDLDAGTYDCVMIYHLLDEEQNTTSTLRVKVTLYIEG